MSPSEIEALLAATTPGPWVLVDRGLNVTSPTANIAVTMGGVATAGEQQANAEWIAKSKEAAESLLARLELAKRLIAANEAALKEQVGAVAFQAIRGYPPSDASLAIYAEWQRLRDEWNATEEP